MGRGVGEGGQGRWSRSLERPKSRIIYFYDFPQFNLDILHLKNEMCNKSAGTMAVLTAACCRRRADISIQFKMKYLCDFISSIFNNIKVDMACCREIRNTVR